MTSHQTITRHAAAPRAAAEAAIAQPTAWDRARTRYEQALAANEAAEAATDAAWNAAHDEVPIPPEILIGEDECLLPYQIDKLEGVPKAILQRMAAARIAYEQA